MRYLKFIAQARILILGLCFATNLLALTDPPVAQKDECPTPQYRPDELLVETNAQADTRVPYVDNNRPIKDLGTDIVVKEFFKTKTSLYNFMKLVYTKIEKTLEKYKIEHGLDERSISLLFKGGNVLRIIANGIFAQLPEKAADLLIEEYSPDFKRSDADFTVYIDDKKLGKNNYYRVLDEVTKLVLRDLNSIREEFKSNGTKYFDFLKLKPYAARAELKKYFKELESLPIIEDKKNDDWFQAKFKQLQLLGERAQLDPACRYFGQFDYRFIYKDKDIIGIPLSDKPNWIVNTDNRTLEWPMGSDPNQVVKFNLVRSKVAFEYTYEKDGKIYRKPIGGELIDVSIPHRKEATIRDFLDNYDKNVAEYTLASPFMKDKFVMKSYSMSSFAHDLLNILFGQFDRPWNGGPKYGKRVNRLFFLALIELMGSYGIGSRNMKEYLHAAREKIMKPLSKLYPMDENTSKLVEELISNADYLSKKWPAITAANDFWQKIVGLIQDKLIANKQPNDEKEFGVFLELINRNLGIADEISKMKYYKINPKAVYNTDMDKLF